MNPDFDAPLSEAQDTALIPIKKVKNSPPSADVPSMKVFIHASLVLLLAHTALAQRPPVEPYPEVTPRNVLGERSKGGGSAKEGASQDSMRFARNLARIRIQRLDSSSIALQCGTDVTATIRDLNQAVDRLDRRWPEAAPENLGGGARCTTELARRHRSRIQITSDTTTLAPHEALEVYNAGVELQNCLIQRITPGNGSVRVSIDAQFERIDGALGRLHAALVRSTGSCRLQPNGIPAESNSGSSAGPT